MPDAKKHIRLFISAGETSGDTYAAWLLEALKRRLPSAEYFGCAGPRLRAAGCEALIESESIAVVGLAEVVTEIPRVWRHYRALIAEAIRRQPDVAVLVDAPDFNLRLARRFRRQGIPVFYLVAPQVWAWRRWRVRQIRRRVDRLACIFPFEEAWFRERGVNAEYIGHPLAARVKPTVSRQEFFAAHGLAAGRPLLALLPGSRQREAALNLPAMLEAAAQVDAQALVAVPPELPLAGVTIPVVRGATYDALAHADVALVASGTVTIETALLGTPMVVVYRVTEPTWLLGRLLVSTRFYSMVNLVAGRAVVPELIQDAFTPKNAAEEINRLLGDPGARSHMKVGLAEVASKLSAVSDPMDRAAGRIIELLEKRVGGAHR
jgi:lipid-A-disaccharide synthase